MNKKAVGLLFCASFLLVSAHVFSATVTWTGTGVWSSGPHWFPSGAPPAVGDDVIISTGTCTIGAAPNNINSLTINSGATLTTSTSITLTVATNATINGIFAAGTVSQTVSLLVIGGNLTVGGAGAVLNTTALSGLTTNTTDTVSVAGFCQVNTGGTITTGDNSFKVGGNLVFNGGTFNFTGTGINSTNLEVMGTIAQMGVAGGTFNASSTSVIRTHGNVDLTNLTWTPGQTRLWILDVVNVTSAGKSFACVRIGSTGLLLRGSLNLNDDMHILGIDPTATGAFTAVNPGSSGNSLTANFFNFNSHNLTIADSGTYPATDNIVDFSGIAAANFTSPGTITFTGASSMTTGGGVLSTVQINSGAALTLVDQLTLTGDWLNLGGTLTPAGQTVIFAPTGASAAQAGSVSPSASITGNNTFANFTCNTVPGATLYFAGTKTQIVTGTFAIAGTSGNQVSLLSSTSGSAWLLNAAAAAVTWAEVKDSSASGAATPIAPTNSTNLGGNNAGWNFGGGGATMTWQGGGVRPNDWNLGANWVGSIIPGVTDNVTIPPVANNPSLTSNVAVNTVTINSGGNLNLATFNLAVTGALNLQSGGTLQLQGQAGQTVTGAPVTLSGTVVYNGAGSYTGLLLGVSYVNLGFTGGGGTYTLNTGPLNVTGNLTLSTVGGNSTLSLNNNNLTVTGSVTAAVGTGILTASGTEAISVGGNWSVSTFNASNSTVTFTGTATQTVDPFSSSFHNVIVSKTASSSISFINNAVQCRVFCHGARQRRIQPGVQRGRFHHWCGTNEPYQYRHADNRERIHLQQRCDGNRAVGL